MMLSFIEGFLKILLALFGLGILVFFHELGHFLMARIFKMKVEVFSIGMGPAIFKIQKGETSFQIGAVPFGGFCKFKGEEITDNEITEIAPDSFYGVPAYKRLLVAFCGPFMNYIIAIIFLTILALGAHKETTLPTKILLVEDYNFSKSAKEEDYPAKKAGLLSGDVILEIDNTPMSSFSDISKYFILNNKKKHNIKIKG